MLEGSEEVNCGVCGAAFFPARPTNQRYCSDECRRTVAREQGRVYREANRERLREWFRNNRIRNRDKIREKSRLRREASAKKPLVERVCGQCGNTFFERHFRAYCSRQCQRDHWNERRAQQRTDGKPKHYTGRRVVDAPKLCAVCGDAFASLHPFQKVCSAVWCQTKRKRIETAVWRSNNLAQANEWLRRYRRAHPEQIKFNARNFYIEHRAKVLENSRVYYWSNKEKVKAQATNYYSRARAAVLWWREHVGPARIADAAKILAALREIEHE